MPSRIPHVRRIGRGVFVVDDPTENKPLTPEERKLVRRIIAANDELTARRLLRFIRRGCKSATPSKRCGGCAGAKGHRKGKT